MNTIQLIEVGTVAAIPASEVKVGDERLYNYFGTAIVIKIIEKSAKTLTFITCENGKYYMFDIRKSTLVAINQSGLDVSMHTPKEAQHRKLGIVDVTEYFPVVEEVTVEVQANEVTEQLPTLEESINKLDEELNLLATIEQDNKLTQNYTNRYPLRYESQANQDSIFERNKVILSSFDHTGGEELFTYYNSYSYENKTNRNGYISVTISSYQGNKFILEIESEYPDRMKYTNHKTKVFESYDEAREWAVKSILDLKQWINSNWWNQLPEVEIEEEVYNTLTNGYRMIAKDGTPIVYIVGDHNRHIFNIPQSVEKESYYYRVRFKQKLMSEAV